MLILAEGTMGAGFTAALAAVWSGLTSCVSTITTTPELMIPVGLMFAGGCIGLAKSLMGTKRRRR